MNEEIRPAEEPVIMVVDDTLANLQLLSEMLKQKQFKVRPLPDGKLALQAAQNTPPDLILLDINMPEMNGYEVCERLKADEKTREIPVIFISALSETIDKIKAFGVGGVDYVTKPFQFEEVVARVETHLELRRQKRALQKSYERLKELELLRDSLAHMIVHDLDNPLGAIQMALELLKDSIPAQNTDDVRMLHAATAGASRLREMIRQLLDISRMEAGQMPLNPAPGDLVHTTQLAMETLSALAFGRRFLLHAPDPVPAVYDADTVGRILGNLLGNALKFSPRNGEVKIAVTREGNYARISVTDNGPGIPPEFHHKIFEKFGQIENQQRKSGFGLGLTFCKLAVEAHGGQIGVRSTQPPPGSADAQTANPPGVTFWFTLPLTIPPPS